MSKNYRISKSDIGHYVAVPLNREGMIRPRPDHHIVVHGKLVDFDKDTVYLQSGTVTLAKRRNVHPFWETLNHHRGIKMLPMDSVPRPKKLVKSLQKNLPIYVARSNIGGDVSRFGRHSFRGIYGANLNLP